MHIPLCQTELKSVSIEVRKKKNPFHNNKLSSRSGLEETRDQKL
jgi:hypothetical protein